MPIKTIMKASELRVGNWINEFNIQRQAMPNDIIALHQIEHAGKICIDLTPVLLTEEWLLKFGFDKTELNGGVIKQYFHDCTPPKYKNNYGLFFRFGEMRNEEYKMYWYASGPVSSSMHSFPCKYVHQLQNLYFALTGEELEIK